MVEETRLKGTVKRFDRNVKGFITTDGGEDLHFHWTKLVSDDFYPNVENGTKVEFVKVNNSGKYAASAITLANGEPIPITRKVYKNRVVNEEVRYKGTIKYYSDTRGFGYLKPDEMITWMDMKVGPGHFKNQRLYFTRDAIVISKPEYRMNPTEKSRRWVNLISGSRVSFKVYKDKDTKNAYLGACEIQNEDETPMALEIKLRFRRGKKRKFDADGEQESVKKIKMNTEDSYKVDVDENSVGEKRELHDNGNKKPVEEAKTMKELTA